MSYSQQAVHVHNMIVTEGVYSSMWQRILLDNGMTVQGLVEQLYSNEMIHSTMFDFWLELPDNPSIRTPAFFAVCEMLDDYEAD